MLWKYTDFMTDGLIRTTFRGLATWLSFVDPARGIWLFCKPRPVGKLSSTFSAGIALVFKDVHGAEESSEIEDRLTEIARQVQLRVLGKLSTPDLSFNLRLQMRAVHSHSVSILKCTGTR